MSAGRIVALGGGGFSEGAGGLDDEILRLAGRADPRVCFLPTASGDAEGYIERFHAAFPPARARASTLRLFSRELADPAGHLRRQHVIYVGGGNTANMLAVWRVHGVDRAVIAAWRAGALLCGVSAGAICWFEDGVTDSFGPGYARLGDGLGLLPGSFCPHWDGEPERQQVFRALLAEGMPAGYAVDDGCALVFEGSRLTEAIAERPGAGAIAIGMDGETPLAVRSI